MSAIIINPEDVQKLETPLYKKDGNVVYHILPESVASQIKMAAGDNVEVRIANLTTNIDAASTLAQTAKDNAATAQTTANQAKTTATQAKSEIASLSETVDNVAEVAASAKTTANSAKATADSLNTQIGNATTGLAATKTIADNALTAANQAKSAGDALEGTVATLETAADELEAAVMALDDGKVSKAGDSVVTGNIRYYNPGFPVFHDTRYSAIEGVTTNHYRELFIVSDNQPMMMARSMYGHLASGTTQIFFELYRWNNGVRQRAGYFSFDTHADGTAALFCPTRPDADNADNAATTRWTRARISAATGKGATTFSVGGAELATMALEGHQDSCAWDVGSINPDMLDAAHLAIKDNITQRIFAGFYYAIGGQEYFFTYDLYDQQNFADNAILANSGIDDLLVYGRDDGNELKEIILSATQMLGLHRYGFYHKQDLMKERLLMKKAVDECTTYPELEFLLEDFGILDIYLDYYAAMEYAYESEVTTGPDAVELGEAVE